MARIRSVHPGLFTDDAFAALSDAAQILLIGLWTESDDQGIFEWKPTTLRMRIRPAKDGSVEALLEELEAVNCIRKYEIAGRQYGAIRNFRKYQRPKSPNSIHPTSEDIRIYVGLSPSISEIMADKKPPIPPSGEKSPQMEEEGGREGGRKKESVEAAAVATDPPSDPDVPDFLDRRKGTRLPDDWVTPDDWIAWAKTNYPNVDAATEALKFANYWQAKTGKDATKLDWRKTWQNWIIGAKPAARTRSQAEQDEICPPDVYRNVL